MRNPVQFPSRVNNFRGQRWFEAAFAWLFAAICVTAATSAAESSADLSAVGAAHRTQAATDGPVASPEPDWPQWNGPRRDGICDEKGLLPAWPKEGPRLIWKAGTLGHGWSSPIIVRNRIYITGDVDDDLVIFALDLEGKTVWQANNGRSWPGTYAGARACCAYSAGKVYHMNAYGRVVCLDAATGKEVWTVDILKQFKGENHVYGMSECLLVDGPRVLVTPGGKKALMAALDKRTGEVLWTTPSIPEERTSNCSPLLFRYAGRRIVANCVSARCFAVHAESGELLWTVPLKNTFGVNVAEPVYGTGMVFCTTPYVYGSCYRLPSGESGQQPEKLWGTTLDTCTGATLLVDGRLFGSGYTKHKSWLCLDWKSGRTLYEFKGLTAGSAVFADGRLYCLAQDGRAALLRPTPRQFEVDGLFRLVADEVSDAWAHPVLLHGKLYLRYHDTLWCYDVRGRS
jgi:outer membrane protein assembly factor BamB